MNKKVYRDECLECNLCEEWIYRKATYECISCKSDYCHECINEIEKIFGLEQGETDPDCFVCPPCLLKKCEEK